MTGKALYVHAAATGSGRPRLDGRVRTRCGKALAPRLIGDPTCTSCRASLAAERRVEDLATTEAARQIKREYMARRRVEHPEKVLASRKAYELRNRKRLAAWSADYRKFFHEECLERTRRWRRNQKSAANPPEGGARDQRHTDA